MVRWSIPLFILGFLSFTICLYAQNSLQAVNRIDTVKTPVIPVEKVISTSLQSSVKLSNLYKTLISEEQLKAEKSKNDSITEVINSLLVSEEKIGYDSLLTRELNNKRIFWSRNRSLLEKQVKITEHHISELSSKSTVVNEEWRLWSGTGSLVDSVYTDSLYRATINDMVLQASSLKREIKERETVCFSELKNLKQVYFKVDDVLTEIKNISRLRQEQLFEKNYPSLIHVDYSGSSQWNLSERFDDFKDRNQIIIVRYYHENTINVYLFVLYLLVLIGVFVFLLGKSDRFDLSRNNVYQKSAIIIFKRPISVAIILAVFSSGLFFLDRPPILIDISIILLIVPILDIVAHVSNKKGKFYFFAFGLLILMRFCNYIFPPTMPIHRLTLLFMGVLELIIMISLFKSLNIREITNQAFQQLVRFIILAHIISSVIGIIANFMGYLRLADIAIDLAITNTLVGLLLIIFTLVVVGVFQFAIDGKFFGTFNFIKKRRKLFKNRVEVIVTLTVSILWLIYILRILRINDLVYQFFSSIFSKQIALGSVSFTFGSVLLFFFIIWLSVVVSDMIKAILEDDILNKVSLKKGVPRMISVIVRFSLISVGVFVAVSAVGMPLDQLTIIISAFSVGIGFGLQNVVSNFVSGIVLLFERPVQIGDTVEVNNLIGKVKSMGIRSSNIRTFDGAEVVVPNANLISNEVINWTLSDKRRRIEIFSGVAYGSDVHQVKDILLNVLEQHPDILHDPQPLVLFNDLGESSLDFRLLFWTDNYDRWIVIKSEVIFMIYDALNEAKIQIPFPQRDIHIISNKKDEEDETE